MKKTKKIDGRRTCNHEMFHEAARTMGHRRSTIDNAWARLVSATTKSKHTAAVARDTSVKLVDANSAFEAGRKQPNFGRIPDDQWAVIADVMPYLVKTATK